MYCCSTKLSGGDITPVWTWWEKKLCKTKNCDYSHNVVNLYSFLTQPLSQYNYLQCTVQWCRTLKWAKHDIQDWLQITPSFVEYMYMISEDTVLLTSCYHFANQRIPKQSLSYTHRNVRMHKDENFSFVSTEFLIGLNSHQILWNLQAACILILHFVNNFLITKSHLSLLK